MHEIQGLVLIGDVVGSRSEAAAAAAWLRSLVGELDAAYGEQRLAPFGFTQGDELQGLLVADADPLIAVLRAALGPAARPIRWACVRGAIDPGEGPATQRTGQAFLTARANIDEARSGHERLILRTGVPGPDELLAGMAPALTDLLEGLTPRQRDVARLALIEGLRQSEVADRLRVRRATVSVSFGRAKIQPLQRLVAVMRKVYESAGVPAGQGGERAAADGAERAAGDGAGISGRAS